MSALVMVAQKSVNGKFSAKIEFPIADADIESLESLQTLFDKYLDHIW